ncbi:hypothetical protein [Acinetobacter indicus]|uniref:hypothetical protein n=1 Tax=Acinetobacter indicus TaxID=756892 RepID=UPI0014442914|nr:hypothetical protein [Acinetobacter indicus]
MNSTNNLALSFVLAGIVCLSVFFVTFSLATLIFAFFILLFGNMFSYIIANKKSNFTEVKIYNIVFCFYVILAINHFLGYQVNWSLFAQGWLDEYKFYSLTDANQYKSISENFKDSYISRDYLEYAGYVFYISTLASIANSLFDGNHLLLQFLGTSLFGVLTSVLVFKILNIYIDTKKSFYYTLCFMFLSVFSFYSFKLLRDIPIAFFYTSGIYILLSRNLNRKYLKLFFLFLSMFLIWQLRFEHGLFFSLFILFYCFKIFKNNKKILVLVFIISIPVLSFLFFNHMSKVSSRLDMYSEFTQTSVDSKEDSFAKYIYQLPPITKEIGVIINSQIQPFPSWLLLESSTNVYKTIEGLLQIIYAFFWFIIFFSLCKWLFFERRVLLLKNEILVLSILCLIFLIANTANMTLRRIIVFYPFIFLLYIWFKEVAITRQNFKVTTFYGCFLYCFLIVIYLFLKI